MAGSTDLAQEAMQLARSRFKWHLLGERARVSQFGVEYETWRNGAVRAEAENGGPRLTHAAALDAAAAYFDAKARTYDTVVWRTLPEVDTGFRRLSFRLHFMRWKDVD